MKKIISLCLILLITGSMFSQTPSKRDKKFAECAARASIMEIKLGELAQTNGSSGEVKKLGQIMVQDHTKANDELSSLAIRKNIILPVTLTDKEQKCYDKLAKKQGADFDKAYAKRMVKDHKKTICLFKKEAKKGDDADLRNWASSTLPKLEDHKHMSKGTCEMVKK